MQKKRIPRRKVLGNFAADSLPQIATCLFFLLLKQTMLMIFYKIQVCGRHRKTNKLFI